MRRHPFRLPVLAIALCLAGAGCALTPPPERSAYDNTWFNGKGLPSGWSSAPTEAYADWIGLTPDAQLAALIREGLEQSQTLQGMALQVQAAGEMITVAGGSGLPQIGLSGSTQYNLRDSLNVFTGGFFGISWEIDVWGRIRYDIRTSEERYASLADDYQFSRLSLAANIGKAWFSVIEADAQLKYLLDSRDSTATLLVLTDKRVTVGAGNPYEAATLRRTLAELDRQVETARLAVRQNRLVLETLVGRPPQGIIEVGAQLPDVAPAIPGGLPSELLERRPDVRAAERRARAAFNVARSAEAARLPRFTLTFGLNSISSDIYVLKNLNNPTVAAGAGINAPLYTGGALAANVRAKNAEQEAARAFYMEKAQQVMSEVEQKLSANISLIDQMRAQRAQLDAARKALDIRKVQRDVGQVDDRAVLNEQITVLAQESALIKLHNRQIAERIDLQLALGGPLAMQPPPGN